MAKSVNSCLKIRYDIILPMDTIETLQFTQMELRYIQLGIDKLLKSGGMNLADMEYMASINKKVQEKKHPFPEEQVAPAPEAPKV